MLHEILDFLYKVFVEWPGDRIAAFVIGVLVGVALLLWLSVRLGWMALPGKARALEREKEALDRERESLAQRVREEQGKNAALHQMVENLNDRHHRECNHIHGRLDEERDKTRGLAAEVEKWHGLAESRQGIVDALWEHLAKVRHAGKHFLAKWKDSERRIGEILSQDGRFWERPPGDRVVPFRPARKGVAAIVAVMNLKGGVGKSTLTANIGFAFAGAGLRVLLIDLDHQATLTSLCLSRQDAEDTQKGEGKLVNNLFKADRALDEVLYRNLVSLPGFPGSSLLAVSPNFLQVEEMVKARWLLHPGERDFRYLLREALHAPLLQERFDLVLIDCPPRPTASCINALAAADQTLIPTLPDHASSQAVPLMLGWMRLLKDRGICPDLKILGVVANRVHTAGRLTMREKSLWKDLERLCKEAWSQPVYHFERTVPNKPAFAEAAIVPTPAAFHATLEPIFRELTEEMLSRKVLHERRKLANVSS